MLIQHRKFLNRSISEMKAAFGDKFHADDPSTTVTESVAEDDDVEGPEGRSDASSLGRSIVRASRQMDPDDGNVAHAWKVMLRKENFFTSEKIICTDRKGLLWQRGHRVSF